MKKKLSCSCLLLSLLMIINSTFCINISAEEEEILEEEEVTVEETVMSASLENAVATYSLSEEDKTPYAEYDFNQNLNDIKSHSTLTTWSSTADNGRSNYSTSFGSDTTNGSYWQWKSTTARGGGFYIDFDKNIGEEYTIGLKFSFEDTSGSWKKIIDYKNSTVDTGFYFYNSGHLNFYNYGVNGASVTSSNQVIDLIVRRNKTTKQFEAYVVHDGNAYLDMSVTDTQDQGVPTVINGKTRLGFFFDDIATAAEASPGGKVYNLKVWDSYMDPQDVIEALRPGVTVVAHYIDEEKDEVLPDVKISGFIGDTYDLKAEEVFGYQFIKSEGAPTSGKLPDNGTIYVTFIYKCLIPYTVTARYVDESGNKLCDDILYKGEQGKPYRSYQLEIEDYEFVRVEGAETGIYTKKPILVTYVYKKEEIPPVLNESSVYVSYVDEDGKNLIEDVIYKGYINEPYVTSQLVFPSYELKQVVGNKNGTYTKDPIQVRYIYSKKEKDKEKGGTVLVHYQDTNGYTISQDTLIEGKVGDNYEAEIKEISRHYFEKVVGVEKGEISEDIQVVTIIYTPMASDVLARYVDQNDLTIADAEIHSGGIGQTYTTNRKDINGYRLIRIDGEETGIFSENVQVVKYVYGQVGNVHVNYLDLDGNVIHEPTLMTNFLNENYQTQPLEIYSYELVITDGNEKGKYQLKDQTVNYIYEKIIVGDVLVQTVEESGIKIIEDKLLFGKMGTSYHVEVPEFYGYELIKTEGILDGNYKENREVVTLTYRLILPDTVTARYEDEDGNLLCQDLIYKGKIDDEYQTYQLEIKNYEFVEVIGEEKGVFKREPQLIRYIYKEKEEIDERGEVLVQYVDKDGNELHSDLSYRGKIGNTYKTSYLTIPGYELKEINGLTSSVFSNEQQVVTYVYVEKESEDPIGGSVIIMFETEEGYTLHDDEIINGLIGDEYQVVQIAIPGYQYIRMEGPFYDQKKIQKSRARVRAVTPSVVESEGKIEESVKVIHLIYEPLEEEKVQATTVIARYVDKNGNLIHFDQIYNGLVRDPYVTEKLDIDGYGLLRVEGEEQGFFNENVQLVTYVYDRIGKVVIKVSDEEGNIIEEITVTGFIGEEIIVDDIEIEGYKYTKGEIKGVFTEEEKEVVLIYKKINKKKDNNSPLDAAVDTSDESNLLFCFGWMMLSVLGMIYLKSKRLSD